MRDMCAEGTTVELSAGVTAGDLCTLHHMGRIRAAQLPSVLYANTRDESKPLENFLDSLENSHKALAGVLKHESNQGRWAYRGQVWSGSARAPASCLAACRFIPRYTRRCAVLPASMCACIRLVSPRTSEA